MKKSLLHVAASILFLTMVLGIFGCGQSSETTETKETTQNSKKITVGFSVYWMSEFSTLMKQAMEENAEKLGVTLLVADGNMDPQKQLAQVENFINQGVDAILCAAIDRDGIIPGVEQAKAAGIPFVGINMYIPNENVTAYVGPNDVLAGELAAGYVVNSLNGTGNVIVIEGGEGFSATEDRRTGIKKVLDANPGITALAIKTANWDRSKAVTLMENYIQAYGDKINGVIAHNDEMALGAAQALESAGMSDKVFIGGIDAIKDACIKIKAGSKYATVFQDPILEGTLGLEYAARLAKGETVDPVENFINMELVTSENVSLYLKEE
ncbi:MAG: substrate-binding domain-containing protein [Proteobacteria bacterium]|nr:substrate-binding domain-containing protein [Pseudomonadota bacterium]MBU1387410.1 substrate-binding domain-containing protein [Pseudomonadota bacterium]MBU1541695.1 substrate-binding domain-containing protein [Pseudomonadota bacterium]MBU2431957.1 substrate-binding domain-containing protein [Pseudomonadota bacterium]MBU2482002.1 substrate-binding domain-containing protein [Pseudomonadota bacterium]